MATRLRGFSVLAICLVLAGCSDKIETQSERHPSQGSAKNLLLICIDTVRADVFYGLGEGRKDALSAWQDSALTFEGAIAPAPWTVPTIASVFTGLWPDYHGVGKLPGLRPSYFSSQPAVINKGVPLFAEAAKEAGFSTTVVSASGWTLGPGSRLGMMSGFDESFAFETPLEDTDWKPLVAKLSELFERQPKNSANFYFMHLMDAHNMHVTAAATAWTKAREPEGAVPAKAQAVSTQVRERDLAVAPPGVCEDPNADTCEVFSLYVSGVEATRDAVAATLETLQQRGMLDDTIVIVFSDHGEEFGEHGSFGHGTSLYQAAIHVPLMIWHPQYEGMTVKEPASLVDIAPTAARWLDFDFVPNQWPGRYLDDYLDPSVESFSRLIYASGIGVGDLQMSAQKDNEKSIWNMVSDKSDYYDLMKDPHELKPFVTEKLVMRFDGHFLDYMQDAPTNEIETSSLSEAQIRRLQSIGYLQGRDVSSDSNSQRD
ncbi:sulfatase-like hydrolase/transferase [Halioglobus sp.]|nr:sulfatase-like hydrolase/transferase [Halioglobus sp.]